MPNPTWITLERAHDEYRITLAVLEILIEERYIRVDYKDDELWLNLEDVEKEAHYYFHYIDTIEADAKSVLSRPAPIEHIYIQLRPALIDPAWMDQQKPTV